MAAVLPIPYRDPGANVLPPDATRAICTLRPGTMASIKLSPITHASAKGSLPAINGRLSKCRSTHTGTSYTSVPDPQRCELPMVDASGEHLCPASTGRGLRASENSSELPRSAMLNLPTKLVRGPVKFRAEHRPKTLPV